MSIESVDELRRRSVYAYQLGRSDGLSGVTRAFGLADGAFTVLFVLIIVAVAALVGGEFLGALPEAEGNDEVTFGEVRGDLESHTSTAIILFAVGLLIIPAAAIIGYLWTQMGGLINENGNNRMR